MIIYGHFESIYVLNFMVIRDVLEAGLLIILRRPPHFFNSYKIVVMLKEAAGHIFAKTTTANIIIIKALVC